MEKPFAITLDVGSSLANRTGSWRVERPVYLDRMPPCNDGCPAGENIQSWLYSAEEGDYETAWRRLAEDNPFPRICGRVCYHPCETACNRAQLDEAVGIHGVERFLGDRAASEGWKAAVDSPPSGKRVLVIGSGPSGLSAAYHLARLGHAVTIYEGSPAAGGMMRYGIPKYRLPRDVLDAEIDAICSLGIELELDHPVDDVVKAMEDGGFDAVFLALGAQLSKRAYIPAADSARILDAVSFLASTEGAEPARIGQRVVVYGGGDTALDSARTARRLGATEAVIVYRRTRERMPAHAIEVEEALAEGVKMTWLSTIARVDDGAVVIEKMALDESGFPQPTGEFETLDADTVVLALGQDTDLSSISQLTDVSVRDGSLEVGDDMMTGHPGIFAGGDMVPAERTVTVAIGHGKKAARHIDAWLRGESLPTRVRHELATFDKLNTWYYSDAPKTVHPELEMVRRQSSFDEIVGGLDAENALFEARRCLSCGNCFECDNCFGVCPDNAVVKLGTGERYAFNYDYCKGCGLCVAECPCGAIVMEPELI
ncbi:MAG: NAD(P)-binding protein [Acidimicrobiales bacterium]|jgi:2-oxoacid:acceptor oxidoreductase delta subunit (pyruvate/2-ketoisovalerate family)